MNEHIKDNLKTFDEQRKSKPYVTYKHQNKNYINNVKKKHYISCHLHRLEHRP